MARGVPVIVSATAGAVEILENKKNAIIVSSANVQAVVEATEELLNDRALRKKIIENGRQLVENMSWQKMYCENAENLLDKIISKTQNGI
jgi:glycosyltransferase involved in cell wall biosynthesis